jgi:hypothetical protein
MRAAVCFFALLATLWAVPSPSTAGHPEPGWIVGEGQHSCGSFLEAMREHPPNGDGMRMNGAMYLSESELYQQWLWGYISAESFRYGLATTPDSAGITQWVVHWCESHPDEFLASAAGAFVAHRLKKN